MNHLTIGQLAKQGGVNLETIRYYERRGILPRPPRTGSGYRAFSDDAVRRLRFIKRAQALGFSLREIGELLTLRARPGRSCASVQAKTQAKIADIEAKLRTLTAMKRALTRLVAACDGGAAVGDCPILESLDTEDDK
jgi:MerR family copper efflux transcriptional regulator